MLTTEGSWFWIDQNDLTLTVMALGISSVGLYSFYNKRKGEQGSIGVAYFVIFAVGILSLFATFLLPIALGSTPCTYVSKRCWHFIAQQWQLM